ncbi:MAG: NYN domain-containing protein, partial [Acidimicrobiales bacterium]
YMTASARVVVFVDYQNVYKRARESFFAEDAPAREGHVHPLALANQLMRMPRRAAPCTLHQVRAYRGLANGRKDPQGNAAGQRQADRWKKSGVLVTNRPLRYPKDWPDCAEKPEEKGIDVALAIDVVIMAHRDQYDVAIIASCDTDLRPAIEAVLADTDKHVEVAAWQGNGETQRLSVPGKSVFCNWLSLEHYGRCADPTDYTQPTPKEAAGPKG